MTSMEAKRLNVHRNWVGAKHATAKIVIRKKVFNNVSIAIANMTLNV